MNGAEGQREFTALLACLQYVHRLALNYSSLSLRAVDYNHSAFILWGLVLFICCWACSLSAESVVLEENVSVELENVYS